MKRKWLAIGIILLLVGTSITVLAEPSEVIVTKTKATIGLHESSRDQVELRYYDPNTLANVVGVQGGVVWKEAIRLTHTELAPYNTWNLTKVVVGFEEDPDEGPMNVTIYIYDIGTPTNPGDIIVDDTWAILNETGLITVPLITPVPLAGHTELWVAVEWTEKNLSTYAYVDDGPHVAGKGDWTYLNNRWGELYSMTQGTIDSNWAIGAIVEGQGLATIAIGAVKGPVGIKTEVQNTGDVDAQNVAWSIAVKGGILGKINKTASGTDTTLAAHSNLPISVPMFIGFGKISIVVKARAANAQEVTATNSAFVLGPLVIGIK